MKTTIVLIFLAFALSGCTKRPVPTLVDHAEYERMLEQERQEKLKLTNSLQVREAQLTYYRFGVAGLLIFVLAQWLYYVPETRREIMVLLKRLSAKSWFPAPKGSVPLVVPPPVASPIQVQSRNGSPPGRNNGKATMHFGPSKAPPRHLNGSRYRMEGDLEDVIIDGTSICMKGGQFQIEPLLSLLPALQREGLRYCVVFDEKVRRAATAAGPYQKQCLEQLCTGRVVRCIDQVGGVLHFKGSLQVADIISNDPRLLDLLTHKRAHYSKAVRIHRLNVTPQSVSTPFLKDEPWPLMPAAEALQRLAKVVPANSSTVRGAVVKPVRVVA